MALFRAGKAGIAINTSSKRGRSLREASGLPGPPRNVITTITGTTTATISWDAPEITGDSEITGYEIVGGGSASVSGTTATITGLSPETSYSFSVIPINSLGRGRRNNAASKTTSGFNQVTGGTVTDISNYNGSGQTWRVHTFTSSGSANVVSASESFRVLVVGGGGSGGGGGGGDNGGGGGGGGGLYEDQSMTITQGTHSITVGSGGQSTSAFGMTMYPGGNGGGGGGAGQGGSTKGSGGGGGAPGAGGGGTVSSGQGGNGGNAASAYNGGSGGHGGTENAGLRPGTPHTSNITGSVVTYAKGGPEGYNAGYISAPTLYGEGGRGGNNRGGAPGGGPLSGYQGVVIVAYRIA